MHATDTNHWSIANQRYLMAALGDVRGALQRHIAARAGVSPAVAAAAPEPAPKPPAAIDALCDLFGLSPFERAVLLLCAGVELDSAFAALCAEANGDPARPYPTFSLAMAALPGDQ